MKEQRRISLVVMLCNLGGAFLIFFYFAYIDLETFYANKAFWRGSQVDWTTFALSMLVLMGSGTFIGHSLMGPVMGWLDRLQAGETADNVPLSIKRRAASAPLLSALVSLAHWLIASLFFSQGGLMLFSTDASTFGRTFVGMGIVGGITTSTLVFLVTDALWRPHLPTFFPSGSFKEVDVVRISVGHRLWLTFLLTGLVPLVILAAITRNGVLSAMAADLDLAQVLNRVTISIFFIITVSIITNILLIGLMGHSLLRPLYRLTQAMNQVATGDLTPRVAITANDELGDLGRHFNTMLNDLEQSQQMRDLFGRYVSKEVADQVLRDGADLGGENVPATALFADIRDFTTLTESLPPQQVVDVLNRYYTRMVDVVVAQGGIVNKFGGDSLLAVFGAPIRQPDHALRAVNAAWHMTRALAEFNAEQLALGLAPITIGVGISSGEMVAGNVGGKERLEYTVIGDPVNLAARLESLTKEWGAPVLLSEHTQLLLDKEKASTRPRERVTVKGKTESTLVYELEGVAA